MCVCICAHACARVYEYVCFEAEQKENGRGHVPLVAFSCFIVCSQGSHTYTGVYSHVICPSVST